MNPSIRPEARQPSPFMLVPIGKVIQGMDVADSLFAEYGEASGGGIRVGKQDALFEEGNAYLERNFPRLDWIDRSSIVER